MWSSSQQNSKKIQSLCRKIAREKTHHQNLLFFIPWSAWSAWSLSFDHSEDPSPAMIWWLPWLQFWMSAAWRNHRHKPSAGGSFFDFFDLGHKDDISKTFRIHQSPSMLHATSVFGEFLTSSNGFCQLFIGSWAGFTRQWASSEVPAVLTWLEWPPPPRALA